MKIREVHISKVYLELVLIFVKYTQQSYSGHLKVNGWYYNSVNRMDVESWFLGEMIVSSWVTPSINRMLIFEYKLQSFSPLSELEFVIEVVVAVL